MIESSRIWRRKNFRDRFLNDEKDLLRERQKFSISGGLSSSCFLPLVLPCFSRQSGQAMSWTTAQKKCCRSDYESCPIKKIIHGVFLLGHQCGHGKRRYALIFRQGIENSPLSCRDAGSYSSAHGLFPPGVPETQPLRHPSRCHTFNRTHTGFHGFP